MDLRPATVEDVPRIREISDRSFQSSYSLSPEQIETLLADALSEARLAERVSSDDQQVIVADDGGEVVGFVDVELGHEALIRWLHVDPASRGLGAGTRLLERTLGEAEARDVPPVLRVLTENEEGGGFPQRFGFQRTGRTRLEFESDVFYEDVYAPASAVDRIAGEPSVAVPDTIVVDDRELTVSATETTPGTDGPFHAAYVRGRPDERYGFFCASCGSADVGSDSLGRLECQDCGNKHLADRWDAAYL